tara:strand:- start:287 stop:466 length:180 start_codon:yes stop_codon:yes gene_type:complete
MTKRKFEIVIETDPNDKFEPTEQELREHLRLALQPMKYHLSDQFKSFSIKAKREKNNGI